MGRTTERMYDWIETLSKREKMTILGSLIGILFVATGIGLATSMIYIVGAAILFIALTFYIQSTPINHRFDIGTRKAEHQYGPYLLIVETDIHYYDSRKENQEGTPINKEGTTKEEYFKIRTVTCKAVDGDGTVAETISSTDPVGHESRTIFGRLERKTGDYTTVRSTEQHVQDITSEMKEMVIERNAHGGNDPLVKSSMETVLGDEWEGQETPTEDGENTPEKSPQRSLPKAADSDTQSETERE